MARWRVPEQLLQQVAGGTGVDRAACRRPAGPARPAAQHTSPSTPMMRRCSLGQNVVIQNAVLGPLQIALAADDATFGGASCARGFRHPAHRYAVRPELLAEPECAAGAGL